MHHHTTPQLALKFLSRCWVATMSRMPSVALADEMTAMQSTIHDKPLTGFCRCIPFFMGINDLALSTF